MTYHSKESKVIVIKDRYFSRFSNSKRLQTAWCLAGAEHFNNDYDLARITLQLDARKVKYNIRTVSFID